MSLDLAGKTREFFAAWSTGYDSFIGSIEKNFAEDAVWEQSSVPTTHSRQEAIGLMDSFHQSIGLESVEVEMSGLWVSGNTVITERIDHLKSADGSILASVPVAGLIEFNEEANIKHWREYFDAVPMMPLFKQASSAEPANLA